MSKLAVGQKVLFGVEMRGRDLKPGPSGVVQLSYRAIDAQGKLRGGSTDALTLNLKDVVADLVSEPGGRMLGAILMNEETVFGLQPKNAVQHGVRIMRLGLPSARAGPVRPTRWRPCVR